MEDLYPNNITKALIEGKLGQSEDSMQPSVQQWKDEKLLRSGSNNSLELGIDDGNTNNKNNSAKKFSLPATHDQIAAL